MARKLASRIPCQRPINEVTDYSLQILFSYSAEIIGRDQRVKQPFGFVAGSATAPIGAVILSIQHT